MALFENVPQVTRNLLIINILMFVATLLNQEAMYSTFALFYPTSQYFHWWQVITHMFMHGGFWHILINMYMLYAFGSVVERYIGPRKFLIFYFVCGLGAVAMHMGVQAIQAHNYMQGIADGVAGAAASYQRLKMTPTVGASGAIYGILIGYAMLFPQSRLTLIFPPITLSAKTWVIIWAVIELFTGVTGVADGVAHFAHLGGMLLGWLLICWWRKRGTLFSDTQGNGFYGGY